MTTKKLTAEQARHLALETAMSEGIFKLIEQSAMAGNAFAEYGAFGFGSDLNCMSKPPYSTIRDELIELGYKVSHKEETGQFSRLYLLIEW